LDVKDFVEQTLKQVLDGLNSANESSKDSPRFGNSSRGRVSSTESVYQDNNGILYTNVEFDVAVTAALEGSGGGKLKIPYFEAGLDGTKTSSSVSRVKFSIPFRLSN
jgi:hypothetical protein